MDKFQVGDFALWLNMPWHEDSANISKMVIVREILPDNMARVSYMSNPVKKTRHTPIVSMDELSDGSSPAESALNAARDAEQKMDALRTAKDWDGYEAQRIVFEAAVMRYYRASVKESEK